MLSNNISADAAISAFVNAFLTTWPPVYARLSAEIAARASADPLFPQHAVAERLAAIDGTLHQIAYVLTWLDMEHPDQP